MELRLKSSIEKTISPLIARLARWAMRLRISQTYKQAIWYRANHNFFHHAADLVARDSVGNSISCRLNDFSQKHIAVFGMWEPRLTAHILSRPSSSGIFLDIGSNIGYFSLLASQRFAKVIAFEPSKQVFGALQSNINRNGHKNITAINAAVSNTEKEAILFNSSGRDTGSASLSGTGDISETVRCAPLQSFLPEEDWPQVRFVKIDVEGGELEVVKSLLMSAHLLPREVEIAIESDGDNAKNREIFSLLSACGFKAIDLRSTYSLDHYLKDLPDLAPISSTPQEFTDCLFVRQAM
jgi:FkbM family methyltransferase